MKIFETFKCSGQILSNSLCFFDRLQPIIAQFDLVLFASSHKKEKKPTIIL